MAQTMINVYVGEHWNDNHNFIANSFCVIEIANSICCLPVDTLIKVLEKSVQLKENNVS